LMYISNTPKTMLLRSLVIVSAATAVSASKVVVDANTDIKANSKLGGRILSKARRLDNNNAYSWVANYSIKFHSCATSEEYYGYGGNNDNNNNNNYNGFEQRLVHFKLCPSDSCSSCDGGADYVIDMNTFVEAYIESKMSAQEYNCEMAQENCYYDDEYACYQQAGLDYCGEAQEGEFQLEEAAECSEMEVDENAQAYNNYQNGGNNNNYNYNNNNNNNGGEVNYFIGPYCSSNGKMINLGVFYDETCSYPAPTGTYEQLNYGNALPYASANIVESSCISCKEPQDADDNNNGDNNDADEVLEICERLYEDSGKCETNLDSQYQYYPNTMACDFIKSLKVGKSMFHAPKAIPAKVLTGVFAVTTVGFGALAYFFHQKSRRTGVNLSSGDGELA